MGATMPTMWEYCVIYLYHDEFREELDRKGSEGWELVTVIHANTYNCFFKRPKVVPPSNPFTQEEIDNAMREIRKSDGRLHLAPFNTTPDTDRIRITVKDKQGFVFDALT